MVLQEFLFFQVNLNGFLLVDEKEHEFENSAKIKVAFTSQNVLEDRRKTKGTTENKGVNIDFHRVRESNPYLNINLDRINFSPKFAYSSSICSNSMTIGTDYITFFNFLV